MQKDSIDLMNIEYDDVLKLWKENEELAQLNLNAEDLLQEKVQTEKKQERVIREIQLDFASLRGRYEETIKSQRELEALASDEQAQRQAAESRLAECDEKLTTLREENQTLRHKVDSSTVRLSQCDAELLTASEHLHSLSAEVSNISATQNQLASSEAEIGILKGDISRLLRLLEHSNATRDFLAHWQDSGGMDFIGIRPGGTHSHTHNMDSTHHTSSSHPHYHTADSAVDALLYGENNTDLTPAEFAHLKRVHGGDPFPMTDTLQEESEYWVPSAAARLGLQFISSKAPHAHPSVIMDFLRSMNKIWLKRERRRVKRVKSVYASKIEDLKRQVANAKPYKGVIAERQIRILKSQVKDAQTKTLNGRPRGRLEQGPYENDTFESSDQLIDNDYVRGDGVHLMDSGRLPFGERRYCKQVARQGQHSSASVELVSTERLLAASLSSLNTMGRKMGGGGVN
eukprot:gene36058-44468_t